MTDQPRRFSGDTLLIASHNQGKVREIADLLAGHVSHFPSAAEHGVPEPEETETSFTGNAILKARHAARLTGLPALADDSGLAVEALDGDPGIFSARWAVRPDGGRDFAHAMAKVNAALGDSANRRARFICALAIAWPDEHVEVVEGTVAGDLVWPPRGDRGFGYDPVFRANGQSITFGEMDPALKHAISHRADAFARLIRRCFQPPGA